MPEIPERLMRRRRPDDPVFDRGEQLFRRLSLGDVDAAGHVEPSSLQSPDFSVNRGKYSEPDDVVLLHPKCGIGQFVVADVPESLRSGEGVEFQFSVEHAPMDDNYSHSEIRSYNHGIRLAPKKPAKSIRTLFRLALVSRMKIMRAPGSR